MSSLGGSGVCGDAPVVGVSGHGGGAGMTSRVAIVSFPPAGVNLHALLLVRVRNANRQYGLLRKRRSKDGDSEATTHLARFVIICLSRVSSPTTIPITASLLGCSSRCRAIAAGLASMNWYAARRASCEEQVLPISM